MFLTFKNAVAAGALTVSLSSFAEAVLAEQPTAGELQAPSVSNSELVIADQHVVYAVDISSSVDANEYATMMRGYKEAFMSDQTRAQLSDGTVRAFTVIFYGSNAYHAMTSLVNETNIEEFVGQAFWDFEADAPLPLAVRREITGTNTDLRPAYDMMARLFQVEEQYGFTSQQRRAVFIGDECPHAADVAAWTLTMAQEHRTVIYGLPVMLGVNPDDYKEAGLYNLFRNNVRTPAGLEGVMDGFTVRLGEGEINPISNYEDAEPIVARAIMGFGI